VSGAARLKHEVVFMKEDLGQMETEVKIAFPGSQNILTSDEENVI
jgi:hypothetical protein